jgi:tRNA A-37 threonylcarbamoyl transferase component Bud32
MKWILRTGRKTRAREEFDLGWKLINKKIRTPRPVWLAEAKGAVARYSILATESIPGAESALQRWRRCTSERQRTELLIAVGQFTGMLHDTGFYHDDYKSGHLLILPNRPSTATEIHVIDLLGGGFPQVLTPLKRARNLFQMIRSFIPKRSIGFTPEHRYLILKSYCGSAAEAHDWEKWVERISRLKGQPI